MIVTAGSTNVSAYFYIVQDASGTSPGEPVTGLLFSDIETGGSASYARQGGARTDLTLVTLLSASAAHTDGGFILVDDTNMPGLYRCDFPDAAFATGVDQVFLSLVVASGKNAVAAPIIVEITDFDLRTASVAQTADHTAAIADVPTVAEFNARTLLAADYFDPAADTVTTVANLTTLPSIPANWITAAGVTAGALDGKGDWNIGKTGYSISGAKQTLDALADLTEAQVNTQVDNALDTAIPGVPTAGSINERLKTMDDADIPTEITNIQGTSFAKDTHSLTNIEGYVDGLELTIGTAGAGLTDLGGMSTAMKAQMVVEVDNALDAAISELGVGAPTATPSIRTALMLQYMALRNKLVVQTSGVDALELYNNAGIKIASKLITDDGADYTEAEMA